MKGPHIQNEIALGGEKNIENLLIILLQDISLMEN